MNDINIQLYRAILPGTQYSPYMPPSDCSSRSLGRGDTRAAIEHMAATAYKYQHHTTGLQQTFFPRRTPLEELCRSIHSFLYHHIQYAIDEEAQLLRAPACTWASRNSGVDCKSYTIFASTILLNAGITHYMRRIRQSHQPDGFTHVYVVVPKNQKTAKLTQGYYTIDGTIPQFSEPPYLEADDILITPKKLQALAAPLQTDNQSQLEQLMNKSYDIGKQNSEIVGQMQKQDINRKTNAIGGAASATAAAIFAIGAKTAIAGNVVPGIGTIIGLCIAAVTALVGLAVLLLYDPCAGAFYTADYINQGLKDRFFPQLKSTLEKLQTELEQGLEPIAISTLNHLLREIDLGAAHYKNECQTHHQRCSSETLLTYQTFVEKVQTAVNNMLQMLQFKLQENFIVTIENRQASTSQRAWYFIVPAARNPIQATYRFLKVENKNEKKGVYPYNHPQSFYTWLNTQIETIKIQYGSEIAEYYQSEMYPLGEKINAIRQNIYLPVASRITLEAPLQAQQHDIYLRYNAAYAQKIKEQERAALESYLSANKNFWTDLQKTRNTRIAEDQKSYENMKKIVRNETRQYKSIEKQKLLQMALLALLGVAVIKVINK